MAGVLSMVTLCEVVVHQRHVIGLYNTVWDRAVQFTLSPFLSPEVTERHKETLSDVKKYQVRLSSQWLENSGIIFDIWVGYFSLKLLWKWQWVYNICFHRTFWEDAVFLPSKILYFGPQLWLHIIIFQLVLSHGVGTSALSWQLTGSISQWREVSSNPNLPWLVCLACVY